MILKKLTKAKNKIHVNKEANVPGAYLIPPIIKNVKKLSGEIDIFFISDKFMNQALTENSNIPYVDINESSGGS